MSHNNFFITGKWIRIPIGMLDRMTSTVGNNITNAETNIDKKELDKTISENFDYIKLLIPFGSYNVLWLAYFH